MLRATKLKLNHLRFTFALRKINSWGPSSWLVRGYLWPSTRAHTEAAYGAHCNLCFHELDKAIYPPLKTGRRRGLHSFVAAFSVKQVLHYCDKSINKTNFCVALAKNWHSYLVMKENILPGTFPCSLLADLIYCGVLIFSWSYDGVLWLWIFLRWL